MEGNKAFTQEDNFIDTFICKTFLNDFIFKQNSSCTTPITAAAFPSSTQVTGLQHEIPVTGAYAEDLVAPTRDPVNNAPRRSRRLAGLPRENDGIT